MEAAGVAALKAPFPAFGGKPAVAAWARSIQDRPNTRIVLAGYVGEHDMPGWTVTQWKTTGGYGNQGTGRGKANAHQECLWFSPQCTRKQLSLFGP